MCYNPFVHKKLCFFFSLLVSFFSLSSCSDVVVINHYILYDFTPSEGYVSGIRLQSVLAGHDGTAVTAVAKASYHFVSWSDGVATETRKETNVQQDFVLFANFEHDS
ncbi:MAG: hypothetical protein BWZ03_00049 [bacterium ADurb.BinA186]|jgi:hypothetical protein|nr:MAG: hypothetical protein BWZ03_00049 [bacterium ADurb.BinA186]